jgi:PAS domain-containing protein
VSSASASSLLRFLDAPIVVGDPEGFVIYVNPAFEHAFSRTAEEVCGDTLAALFGGGGREAILSAVAEVCSRGRSVRFKLREAGAGYLGLASPIESEDDRVGVVILLTDEPKEDERLLAFQAEVAEPLDEAGQVFEELIEQTGGRRDERYRVLVERGLSALERARKWNEELHATLCGRGGRASAESVLEPVQVLREVVARLATEVADAGVALHLLAPNVLPAAAGDAAMLETALIRLIRHRIADARSGAVISLSASEVAADEGAGLVFAVVDSPPSTLLVDRALGDAGAASESEPRAVRGAVVALGGEICTLEEGEAGRVTAIRLRAAPSA